MTRHYDLPLGSEPSTVTVVDYSYRTLLLEIDEQQYEVVRPKGSTWGGSRFCKGQEISVSLSKHSDGYMALKLKEIL